MPRTRPPRSAAPPPAERLPRLLELYRAVASTGGERRKIHEVLGISAQAVSQRLCLLRQLGVARSVILHNPLALKGACQSTAWVRLAPVNAGAVDRFEEAVRRDDAVVSAQRVVGDCDYRLSCFHPTIEAAAHWLNAMRCRPDVAEVRQAGVRHIFGHELQGVLLWDGPPARRPRRGASASPSG
jgi:DNA-binding Lrp family transcriptional regulator